MPRPDDDLLPELPPVDGDEAEPEDDSEQDYELETEGAEDVGLDADAGLEEEEDDTLAVTQEAEDEHWSEGTDAASDLDEREPEEPVEAEEYGWTEGTEAPGVEAEDWDDAEHHDDRHLPSTVDDRGEEGIPEDHGDHGHDDEAGGLPPLERHEALDDDASAEDLDLQEDGRIDGGDLSFEEERRRMGASLPPPLPRDRRSTSYLGPDDDALVAVWTGAPTVLACGSALYRTTRDAAAVERGDTPLAEQEPTSMAVMAGDDARIAIGTRTAGALGSDDGGRTWLARNAWRKDEATPLRLRVAYEPSASGARLWGWTPSGALHVSADFGATWRGPALLAPVAALTSDGASVIAVCIPRGGHAQIARSRDGGQHWTVGHIEGAGDLGVGEELQSEAIHVAMDEATITISNETDPDGPFLTRDGGATWQRLSSLPNCGPIALVREGGQLVAYAALFFASGDRGVVVRRPLDSEGEVGAEELVVDIDEERTLRHIEPRGDPDGDNRVYAIAAERSDDRAETRLWLCTGAGLFRLVLHA